MPHMMTSRPRLYSPMHKKENRDAHLRWETINALTYKLGGLGFIVASILFLPSLSGLHFLAAGLFFLASLCYLLVTLHDLVETLRYWLGHQSDTFGRAGEILSVASYFIASLLFTLGSLYFLPDWGSEAAGAWCFIIGSGLFMLGATLNLPQIVTAPTKRCVVLFNLTLVTFLIGSALFLVASVPYLMQFPSTTTAVEIQRLAVGQFIAASALFLLGGLFIYWRLYVMKSLEASDTPSRAGKWAIRALGREIEHEKVR